MATGQEVGRQVEADLSNRVATATGSTTARALKDRFADVVNVKDFGANPAASAAANTTAIQLAATAAAGGGILTGIGSYSVSDTITLPSNITIIAPHMTLTQTAANKPTVKALSQSGIVIDGLILTGFGATDSASTTNANGYSANARAYGLWFDACTNVTVDRVTANYHRNAGLVLHLCSRVRVRSGTYRGTRGTGAYVTPGSVDAGIPDGDGTVQQFGIWVVSGYGTDSADAEAGTDILIEGNWAGETHHAYFVGPNYSHVTLRDNRFNYVGQHGFYVVPYQHFTVSGHKGTSYLSSKLQGQHAGSHCNPTDLEVSGCELRSAGSNALEAFALDEMSGSTPIRASTYLDQVRILGNDLISDAGGGGLFISSVRNALIENNTGHDLARTGFLAYNSTYTLRNNRFSNVNSSAGSFRWITNIAGPYQTAHIGAGNVLSGLGAGPDAYLASTWDATLSPPIAWAASKYHGLGVYAQNGGNVYKVVGAGVSASSGGPSGVGTGIVDGGITWDFVVAVASVDQGLTICDGNEVLAQSAAEPTRSMIFTSTSVALRGNRFAATTKLISTTTLVAFSDLGGNVHGGFLAGNPYTGFDNSPGIPGRNYYGSAAPVSGTWQTRDRVWNTGPTAGGTLLWVCVAGGSPGTWKAVAIAA
jgi:hypothetical protein